MSGDVRDAADFVRALRTRDVTARDAAVERLVELGALAHPAVLFALRDPHLEDTVLSSLRIVLDRTASERLVEPLVEILYDARCASPTVYYSARVLAAHVLGNVGGARACEALLRVVVEFVETYENSLWSVAWRAIQSLGRHSYAPAAPVLVEALAHPDEEISGFARYALIQIGTPAVLPLLSIYRYGPAEGRSSVLSALGWIGDPRAAAVALAAFEDRSSSQSLRSSGAFAIGSSRAPDAYEILSAVLHDATEPEWVCHGAVKGLGRLGDRRAYSLLAAIERSAGLALRITAIEALGHIDDDRVAGRLVALLESPDLSVVRHAARALGVLGDERALPSLHALAELALAYEADPVCQSDPKRAAIVDLHPELRVKGPARYVANCAAAAAEKIEARRPSVTDHA